MSQDAILVMLVWQGLQVAMLAASVWGIVRIFAKDRPHLAHTLWALVLIKCVTPPLVPSPISPFSWMLAERQQKEPIAEVDLHPAVETSMQDIAPPALMIDPDFLPPVEVETELFVPRASVMETEPAPPEPFGFASLAVGVWLSGAAIAMLVTLLRLWAFKLRVRRHTIETPGQIQALAGDVAHRLGIRRRIRLLVVDAKIGPALIGIFRPTVLLPRLILEGKQTKELEPLIAHELVHLRRGDLWWAALQTVSASLWWFHPFVWLADRLLTREAERSCDEETIASLKCEPADYARSLLRVLEQKQTLQSAPSLPGIRPVDITANRMERIMRLGQGCHARSPWWVSVVLLLGAVIALPGAALVLGQERSTETNEGERNESAKVLPSPPLATPAEGKVLRNVPGRVPSMPVAALSTDDTDYQVKTFDVADLLDRLSTELKVSKEAAAGRLLERIPFSSKVLNEDGSTTANRAQCEMIVHELAEPLVLGNDQPTMKLVGSNLYVFESKQKLPVISEAVERLRLNGFLTICVQAELFSVPGEVLNELQIGTEPKVVPASFSGESAEVTWTELGQAKIGLLSAQKHSELLSYLRGDEAATREVERLAYPIVMINNGGNNSIQTGQRIEVAIPAPNGQADSIKREVIDGLSMDFSASTRPTSVEDLVPYDKVEKVWVEVHMRQGWLEPIDNNTATIDGVPIPKVRTTTLATGVELEVAPKPQVLCFVVKPHKPMGDGEEFTVAFVECSVNPPPAPKAKLSLDQLRKSWVTVAGNVSDEEYDKLAQLFRENDIPKYRRRGKHVTVIAIQGTDTEDAPTWKRALKLYEDEILLARTELAAIRKAREVAASPAHISEAAAGSKTRGTGLKYYRIPILGPITSGGPAKALDPLSDDELASAFADWHLEVYGERKQQEATLPDDAKFIATKIADYVDPKKFVPLIGNAQLHHAHYKVVVRAKEGTGPVLHTFYVDHNHYHMLPTAPGINSELQKSDSDNPSATESSSKNQDLQQERAERESSVKVSKLIVQGSGSKPAAEFAELHKELEGYGLDVQASGDLTYHINENHIDVTGSALRVSESDEAYVRGNEGRIRFFKKMAHTQRVELQFSGDVEVRMGSQKFRCDAMERARASSGAATRVYRGNVQFEQPKLRASADKVSSITSLARSGQRILVLEGNVHVVTTESGREATLHCDQLQLNPMTGEIKSLKNLKGHSTPPKTQQQKNNKSPAQSQASLSIDRRSIDIDILLLQVGDQLAIESPTDSRVQLGDVSRGRGVEIQPDGNIYLPLIDPVRAVGLTYKQLQQKLEDAYGKVLNNPSVSVVPVWTPRGKSKKASNTPSIETSRLDPKAPTKFADLTLEECIRIALQNSKLVRVVEPDESKDQTDQSSAGGVEDALEEFDTQTKTLKRLVGASRDVRQLGSQTKVGQAQDRGVLADARIPVVLARINEDIQLHEFETNIRNLVKSVEDAYWDLYVSYRNYEAAKVSQAKALDLWRVAQAKAKLGNVPPKTEAQARALFHQFRGQVHTSLVGSTVPGSDPLGLYGREQVLREKLGWAAQDGQMIRPASDPTVARVHFNWEDVSDEALQRNVELRRHKWDVKQRELELVSAKNQILPQLNATAFYRWLGVGDLSGGKQLESSALKTLYANDYQEIGARLEFTPQAIGKRRALVNIQNQQLSLTKYREELSEKENMLMHEISRAWRMMDSEFEAIKDYLAQWLANEDEIEIYNDKIKGDVGELKHLLDNLLRSEERRARSHSLYYQAIAEYNKSLAEIHYLKGSLLDYNGLKIAEEHPSGKSEYRRYSTESENDLP